MTDEDDFIEPPEDDELGEFVDGLEDDSEMSGLAEGLDPDLADSLRMITADTGRRRRVDIATEPRSTPSFDGVGEAELPETAAYETYELEVDHEKANALLKSIYKKLQQRRNEPRRIEELILGIPQYRVLEPWAQAEHNESIESVLPVREITLVPGPMIHPVVPSNVLFHEHLKEREFDE